MIMLMKKLFASLCFAFLFVTIPMQAQYAASLPSPLKFGITAGLNITQVSVSNSTSVDMKPYVEKIRPGFLVGPTVMYTLTDLGLGVDISALYDMRAAEPKKEPKTKVKTHAFQVPVNIRYCFSYGDMAPFVFAGAQLSYNTGSQEQVIDQSVGSSTGNAMNLLWKAKKSSYSVNFGVGVIAMDKVQARISYNLSLSDTGEFERVDLVTNNRKIFGTGKFNACQVSLSYLF
jgi:hypothetical protein